VPDRRRHLSIIVSPIRNLSGDAACDHLAEIITDNLTTDLSHLPGVFVNARPLIGTHQPTAIDVRQVAMELGVSYLVRGTIRGISDRTGVSFQLIDVDSFAQIWAERFEIDLTGIADPADEIAGRLARTVYVKLIEDVSRHIEALPSRDWTSYDHIMRGRSLRLRPVSAASRQDAATYFERALSMDPRSAAAKLGISTVLISNLLDGWSQSLREDEARAEQLLLEVLQDDAGIPDIHTSTGMLRRLQGRLSDSEIELKLAAELAPNNLHANAQLGITMVHLGHPDAAIPLLEKCLRLAPNDMSTPGNHVVLGLSKLLLGRVDEAVISCRNSRAGNPRLSYAHWFLAAALGLRGELSEANDALRQAIEIKPDLGGQSSLDEMLRWTNPRFLGLYRGTVYLGLLRAGLRKTARHFVPLSDE
jgi:adenylate cyclase